MKGETQALLLEKMMQNKKVQPVYELILPLFMVKRSDIDILTKGDILLVGLRSFKIIIISNDNIYANVEVIKHEKMNELEIISMDKILFSPIDSKYEVFKCLFSTINIELFEVGTTQDISDINFKYVTLLGDNNQKKLEGKLVEVKGEIAIKITKVYDA
jgi:hypothetical protein